MQWVGVSHRCPVGEWVCPVGGCGRVCPCSGWVCPVGVLWWVWVCPVGVLWWVGVSSRCPVVGGCV